MTKQLRLAFWLSCFGAFVPNSVSHAAPEILLPQARTAFQTNETIDVSVFRSADKPLAAGELVLTLIGRRQETPPTTDRRQETPPTDADGSRLSFTFPVAGGGQRKTEHLHVNGWLLRPGKYTVEAAVDGAEATAEIEVYSHIRQSSFRLINWGRANKREEQLIQGEDSLGFNMFYGGYGNDDAGHFIRAGVDFMANCVMSGGHQMDLRLECDWSDPYVTRGGTRRVVRRAMFDRTRPNVPGVHFYDEPGLTWHKHPETGEFGPHGVPAQVRSYEAAYGRQPPPYHKVDPNNPQHVAAWRHWARWKLGLMDAAWKEAQFGVSQVRPDFLSVTQSQYGWSAPTDGYYFNVVRSLPVTSGHGGYHDYGLGTFNPSYFLEMARARDRHKPCWYLPTWYGNTTSDQFRLEQYLSFMTGIQGMMSPPDCEPATNPGPRQGIVESNQLMKRLGTIFTTMSPTKPPVAMLYSLSQAIHTQTKDRKRNYVHDMPQGKGLPLTYLAGKLIQQQFLPIVEEDVLDGSLAADHKVVVLTSLDYLDPQVVSALEDFVTSGGRVLMTGDCTVAIKGATKLIVAPRMPDQDKIDELMKAQKYDQLGPFTTVAKHMDGAMPLAKAIRGELEKAGIKPLLASDVPTIVTSRQAEGDIEYLFAVNATPDRAAKDEKGNPIGNALDAADADLRVNDDSRPNYDAVRGGLIVVQSATDRVTTFRTRFGPGQMKVFARPARRIGGVRLSTPVVTRELVREESPLRLTLAATLVDDSGKVLSGSAPLQLQIIDPAGVVRYDLYRATKLGHISLELPLAANDPPGTWKVVVRDLLALTEGTTTFEVGRLRRVGSLAGAAQRAVYAANDRDNAFRFARTHYEVTIVKGKSSFNDAAAQRLTQVLKPWGITCKEMPLDQAAKARTLTEDEARTWAGLVYAGSGQIKPGSGNSPAIAGFAVQGPVILLGNPDDHPIIKFLLTERFLPYTPNAAKFPGHGRGMLAWQRDGVGPGQESITLIAYDEAGMAEAIGSFYEAVAGIEPLTKWGRPSANDVRPAVAQRLTPAAKIQREETFSDRVTALKAEGGRIKALAHSAIEYTLNTANASVAFEELSPQEYQRRLAAMVTKTDSAAITAAQKQSSPQRLVKLVAKHGELTAIAYWGGTLEVRDAGAVKTRNRLPQDITALTWANKLIFAGLANGRLLVLEVGK
jgi:hypothetical protein